MSVAARERDLHQRQGVSLDQGDEVHLLERGALVLAAVPDSAGGALAQRVLKRVGPGSALIAATGQRSARRSLWALAAGDARVRSLPFAPWWRERREPDSQACRHVEVWVERLARLLQDDDPPGPAERVDGGCELEFELADGQVLCARRRSVVWVRVLEGRLFGLDDARLELTPDTGVTPLGAELWLRARGPARVRVLCTLELDDAREVLAGVARLGAFVLERTDTRDKRELEDERARLFARERRADQEVESALADLAGVLSPRAAPLVGDDLALRAMTLVGRGLGVEVRPAPPAHDLRRAGDPFEAIARASHLRVRMVRLSGRWWRSDCGALVGFSDEDGHVPWALLPCRGGGYERVDARDGSRALLDAGAAAQLESHALQVYRPLPEGRLGTRPLLRFALVGRRRDFALALWLGLAATLLGMLTPLATEILMDQVIPDADRGRLLELGLVLAASAFGVALFEFAAGWLLQRVRSRMETDTQSALWDRLLRLRPSFFRRFSSGDLLARVTSVEEVGRALGGSVVAGAFSALLALSNLALLFHYSARLAWIALGLAALVLLVTAGVGALVQRRVAALVECEGRLFGFVVQLLDGIAKLRVAGAEKRAFARWLREHATQLALWSRVQLLADRVYVFGLVVPPLGLALLLLASTGLLDSGDMSLGVFLAFHTAFATFLAAVTALSDLCVDAVELHTRMQRARPILEEEPESDSAKADPGRLSGRLGVESLTFRYPGAGACALERVEFDVEPGEMVALVGPSGSGKSTLLRMLLGFESPAAGRVLYDGQDLRTLDVHAVRRQIGVVLQGGAPEAASILENISGGSALTLEDAWAAAEDAGLAEDIRRMPMGMHTLVSVGGANLSGGQRQRLVIARALAMRPRILLLDEATSALDNRTQEQISSALERMRITRVVIAHRLSTVRRADRIHVLERGRIVQSGTFGELARAPGRFAAMMSRQFA
ncbi:MAG TPA: NHLP bacteriocin export ABC transporter permease/ATPase subunit [Planctomycetota bacterium]|nr:NHLP bacteriocin export ABC transporter permease/ATPase subunit [Planctomycetota bacterium]